MSQTSLPPAIDQDYLALLDSDRISGRTRQVMEERAQTSDAGYTPRQLSQSAYDVLGALAARVLPQTAILPMPPSILRPGLMQGWVLRGMAGGLPPCRQILRLMNRR